MTRSIVIVSNAPCLKGCGLGHIIDSFDDVVRFNSYVTEGYEADVGTKVTIWSRMYRVDKRPALPKQFRKLARQYVGKGRKDKHKARCVRNCELIPDRLNQWCRKEIGQAEQLHVSSGILVIAYLLEEYSVMHSAGFYKSCLDDKDFAKHYWEPKRKPPLLGGHQPYDEKTLYDKWVTAGRVIELPLPGEDSYGHTDHWSNPCSLRVQEVPWQAPRKDSRRADDKARVPASKRRQRVKPRRRRHR